MTFLCDSTLGKLKKYLRMLGFDTVSIDNPDILKSYEQSNCPPLFFTKKTKNISYHPITVIKTNKIEEQIREIKDIIKPYLNKNIFMTRCIECNSLLESTDKKDIEARIPEYIYHNHEEFKVCPSCKKVYWEGTHANRIKKWIRTLNLNIDE